MVDKYLQDVRFADQRHMVAHTLQSLALVCLSSIKEK